MKSSRIAAGITLGALSAALFATPAMADRDFGGGTLDREYGVGTDGTRVT
ncbi:hypothetical protein [Nonomuraea sp. KM88]